MPDNQAWRKYRIALGEVDSVAAGTAANIRAVTHVRIWYETTTRGPPARSSASSFRSSASWAAAGSGRACAGWGTRPCSGPADKVPGEEFFLGEVNNKENPDFELPFAVRVDNNLPEKEQALVLDFKNLEPGHLMRTSKQVSVRGDDYTTYRELTWYWYNPSHNTADVDLFFRVGADTLNYYEVAYAFADRADKVGWQVAAVDLKDLSNVKNAPVRRRRRAPRRAAGCPRQRRVPGARWWAGPTCARSAATTSAWPTTRLSEPVTGYFYFNDIKLEGVKTGHGHGPAGGRAREHGRRDQGGLRLEPQRRRVPRPGLAQGLGRGRHRLEPGAPTSRWTTSCPWRASACR